MLRFDAVNNGYCTYQVQQKGMASVLPTSKKCCRQLSGTPFLHRLATNEAAARSDFLTGIFPAPVF
jgi:hypothetical protein